MLSTVTAGMTVRRVATVMLGLARRNAKIVSALMPRRDITVKGLRREKRRKRLKKAAAHKRLLAEHEARGNKHEKRVMARVAVEVEKLKAEERGS